MSSAAPSPPGGFSSSGHGNLLWGGGLFQIVFQGCRAADEQSCHQDAGPTPWGGLGQAPGASGGPSGTQRRQQPLIAPLVALIGGTRRARESDCTCFCSWRGGLLPAPTYAICFYICVYKNPATSCRMTDAGFISYYRLMIMSIHLFTN